MIFFHLTLFGAVLVSGFWSIVNERFDARTARKYIGRIGVGGIVGGLIVNRLAADNYRRLDRYLIAQKAKPRAPCTSWLRTEAKRVGRAHLEGVALVAEAEEAHGAIWNSGESRPREEIAAELMLSRPSVVAMLEAQNKK